MMHRAFRDPAYHASWLAPAMLVAALGLLHPSIVLRLQDQLFDLYQRIAPRAFDARAPVRIVDIDDASVARIGQWPWPRTTVAALVDRLRDAGAAAIGFDIVFSERDRTSSDLFIAGIADDVRRSAVRTALGDVPSNDAVLAKAVGAAPVALGLVLTQDGGRPALAGPYGFAHTGRDPAALAPAFDGAVAPLAALAEQAAGLGAVNWLPDGDQTVRRVPLLLALDGRLVPSLAMECVRVAQGASTYLVRAAEPGEAGGIEAVRVGALTAPTGGTGDMRVRFTAHRTERFIAAWTVLDGSADPSAIAGRVVIVGSSSAGLTDIRSTPVDPAMPGVEVQAQAVEGLLAGTRLDRPEWRTVEVAGGAALALLVAALLPLVPAAASAAAVAGALAAIVGASWWAFAGRQLLLDPLVPGAMVFVAYGGGLSAMFRTEQRDRRFVEGAFGRFVSPDVVSRLSREPGLLTLGGELRPLTVMFADIRNFSRIAERMGPQDLTRFMNSVLSPMSEIVLAHGGTVDKYIGDCVMAFWNAPLPDPGHGERAARAALAMLAALPEVAQHAGTGPVRCGIGLATGPCVVGNLGSHLRFDYSALGDDVNLASRLEGLTKTYGLDVLASEAARAAAPMLAWIEVDEVVVAGRQGATRLWTLVGDEAVAASPSFVALRDRHGLMLEDYRARRFAVAQSRAGELRLAAPPALASLYAFFADRCAALATSPPPPDWDGVTRFDKKPAAG